MTHPATGSGAIDVSAPRRDRRLRRTALAAALAAAGLASTNAWAATDICTTATTTVSSNIVGADDKVCLLDTAESLAVNAGISFAGSTVGAGQDTVSVGPALAGSINNSGTIFSVQRSITVIGTLSGGITNQAGAFIDGGEGVVVAPAAQIQSGIANFGTIMTHGSDNCDAIQVFAPGSITGGIFNRGAITRSSDPNCVNERAIANFGSIDSIDNLQGGGTPLTLRQNLPGTYRIIVDSTASFGRLQATNPLGTMTVGISPGSTLQVNTYADVLIGVPPASVVGPLSGTFGGLQWELVVANAGNGVWDLVVTLPAPVGPAAPVPALPVWGGALLSALLGALAALGLRRRRRD